jgi:hypothetical protein
LPVRSGLGRFVLDPLTCTYDERAIGLVEHGESEFTFSNEVRPTWLCPN